MYQQTPIVNVLWTLAKEKPVHIIWKTCRLKLGYVNYLLKLFYKIDAIIYISVSKNDISLEA